MDMHDFNGIVAWVLAQFGDNGKLVLTQEAWDSLPAKFCVFGTAQPNGDYVLVLTEDNDDE